ncbi:MAG: hypothetical protein U0T85_06770 [Cloacibacterium normanense]
MNIDYLWKNLAYLPITDEGGTKRPVALLSKFQGLTKDLLAQIKAIPEFVKAEEVLGEKGRRQFLTISFRRKRSI